jgi:hypothetical protein
VNCELKFDGKFFLNKDGCKAPNKAAFIKGRRTIIDRAPNDKKNTNKPRQFAQRTFDQPQKNAIQSFFVLQLQIDGEALGLGTACKSFARDEPLGVGRSGCRHRADAAVERLPYIHSVQRDGGMPPISHRREVPS